MLRNRVVAMLLAATPLSVVAAQQPAGRLSWPFLAGAVTAGVTGFTEQSTVVPALGAYGYAAFPRMILGLQGGRARGTTAEAVYGMATLGYPARAINQSLVYPFVGAGVGVLQSVNGSVGREPVYGAGVGADRLVGDGARGVMVGVRGGYVFRTEDAGTRAIYLAVAIGAAGRPGRTAEKPPVIVAGR